MSSRRPQDFDEKPTQVVGDSVGGDDVPTAQHDDIGVVGELHATLASGEARSVAVYHLPDEIVVGRGSACDWQLEDNSLSRRHATFHWDGHRIEVEDLGSANGTRVGGRPVKGRAEVWSGQVVLLGKVEIVFTLADATETGGLYTSHPDGESTQALAMPAPARPAAVTVLPTQALERAAVIRPPIPPQALLSTPALSDMETRVGNLPGSGPPVDLQPIAALGNSLGAVPPPSSVAETRVSGYPQPTAARRAKVERTSDGRAVFRPPVHAAGPDDVTISWDPAAATAKPSERLIDPRQVWALLKARWRDNRRPFVLGGAALWVALLLVILFVHEKHQKEEAEADAEATLLRQPRKTATETSAAPTVTPIRKRAAALEPTPDEPAPKVTSLDDSPTVTPIEPNLRAHRSAAAAREERMAAAAQTAAAPDGGMPSVVDRDGLLAQGVAAYDQGKLDEALAAFRKLGTADPDDPAVKYMINLLAARGSK